MSKQRVRKLSLAIFMLTAAVSLDCRNAYSQEQQSSQTSPLATAEEVAKTKRSLSPEGAAGSSTSDELGGSDVNTFRASSTSPQSEEGASRLAFFAKSTDADSVSSHRLYDFAGVQGNGGGQQAGQQAAQPYTPLTPGGKMRRAFRRAFLSPEGYIRVAISAAITEATEEDLPHKTTEDRFADGLSRFAIKFGSRATRTLLGSGVYPVLFKQDPRYERSQSKNIGRRVLHAVSRVFVTRGDGGGLQPNYSRFAGNLSAAALSNLWEQSTPDRDRIGADATLRRFATSFPNDALNFIVFNEFMPDIIRIFRR